MEGRSRTCEARQPATTPLTSPPSSGDNGTGRCPMNKLIAAVTVLAVSTAQAGVIRYVDDDAPPGGDGLSC